MNISLLGTKDRMLCYNSKMPAKILCSEMGFLEGDWIMRALYSSIDELIMECTVKKLNVLAER